MPMLLMAAVLERAIKEEGEYGGGIEHDSQ